MFETNARKFLPDWHLVISDFAHVICLRLQLQIRIYFKNWRLDDQIDSSVGKSLFLLLFLSSTLGEIITSIFPSKIVSSQLQSSFTIRKTEWKNHGQMLSNYYTTIFRPFHIVQIRIWSSSANPNTKQKPNTPSQW